MSVPAAAQAMRAELAGIIAKYGHTNLDTEVLDRVLVEAQHMRGEMRVRCVPAASHLGRSGTAIPLAR